MPDVSSLTLNRLSVYLRCLRILVDEGVGKVSSTELADRFHLSASQIRKDLAQFGEFGIRGVGYDVVQLVDRLRVLLGLESRHGIVIVGAGNLGTALARFPGFNSDAFRVVALVDSDPKKVGRRIGDAPVRHSDDLAGVVAGTGAELGILAVPGESAQDAYDGLVRAGIRAVLSFAPSQISDREGVRLKTVDLRINLEELAYYLS